VAGRVGKGGIAKVEGMAARVAGTVGIDVEAIKRQGQVELLVAL
jgi:hypothetical protein